MTISFPLCCVLVYGLNFDDGNNGSKIGTVSYFCILLVVFDPGQETEKSHQSAIAAVNVVLAAPRLRAMSIVPALAQRHDLTSIF